VVGRFYFPVSCFGYARGVVHEYPTLRVKLFNLAGEELEVELGVDTGFEGSILLDREAYEFFAVGELPREAWRRYRTLAGPLPMRTARAVAELGGRRFEVLVETPCTTAVSGSRGASCSTRWSSCSTGRGAKPA
jgi:predicted aspartyl protease